jgi:hypothetical protein
MADDNLPKALGEFISRSPKLNLLALTFEYSEISVEKLNQIFHSRPALKILFLKQYTQITDRVLDRISYLLPELFVLALYDCKGFTPLQLAQNLKKFSFLGSFFLKAEDSFCKAFVTICKDLLPDFQTIRHDGRYNLRLEKVTNRRS